MFCSRQTTDTSKSLRGAKWLMRPEGPNPGCAVTLAGVVLVAGVTMGGLGSGPPPKSPQL